jgi:hypothetical protein
MARNTLSLDEALAERLRDAAERNGMSLSNWVAQIFAERTSASWPADILALSGTWADVQVDRPEHGEDLPHAWH